MNLSLSKNELYEILDWAYYKEIESCSSMEDNPLIKKIKKCLGIKNMNKNQTQMLNEWATLRSPNTSPWEIVCRDTVEINGSSLEPEKQYNIKAGDTITGFTVGGTRSLTGVANRDMVVLATKTMWGTGLRHDLIADIDSAIRVTKLNLNGSIQFADSLEQVGSGPQTEREHARAHERLVRFILKWKKEICEYKDFLFYLQNLLEYKKAQYGHENPMETWDILKIKYGEVYNFVMAQKRRNRGVMPRKSWAKAQDLAQVMGEEEEQFNSWLAKIAS